MKPIFVDIHIHTSENPNSLPSDYDVKELIKNIRILSGEYDVLLSLSDHNTINKNAYMSLIKEDVNVLIGVELHVKKYDDAPPYHCHLIFNKDVTGEVIDEINYILGYLYPNKIVTDEDTKTPNIESIINAFDSYEFYYYHMVDNLIELLTNQLQKALDLILLWRKVFIIIILMDLHQEVVLVLKVLKNILRKLVLENLSI